VQAKVQQLLQLTQVWQHKHAAIMMLLAMGEGCCKGMELQIEQIIDAVVPHTTPEHHARVCYVTCNALGQMSTDFASTLRKKACAKVLVHCSPPCAVSTRGCACCDSQLLQGLPETDS